MQALILIASLLAANTQPAAPDKARAQKLVLEGSNLYEAGKIEAALAKFEAAFAAYPAPKILFNVAQANRDLGRPVEAIEAFDRFISGAPDADPALRNEAKRYVAELHTQVGWIEIENAPEDADILVDGKVRARTPVYKPIAVEPGERHVVIDDHRGKPHRTVVSPRAGQTVSVTVAAVPSASSRSAAHSGPNLVGDLSTADPSTPVWNKRWFIVGAGATALMAVAAIVAGLSAGARFDDLKNSCAKTPEGCSNSQIDGVTSRATAANVFWALTAVGAVATGTLVYLDTREPGISVAWRF